MTDIYDAIADRRALDRICLSLSRPVKSQSKARRLEMHAAFLGISYAVAEAAKRLNLTGCLGKPIADERVFGQQLATHLCHITILHQVF